jgi:hypothetical protein
MRRLSFLTVPLGACCAGFLGLAVVSCSGDGEAQVRTAPRPGFVRTINLGDVRVTPTIGENAPPSSPLQPSASTDFSPVRPRPLKVFIAAEGAGSPMEADLDISEGKAYSVVVLHEGGAPRLKVLADEQRQAEPKKGAFRLINLSGRNASVSWEASFQEHAPVALEPGAASSVFTFEPGQLKASVDAGGTRLGPFESEVESGQSYTLVIFDKAGRPEALLILNNPAMRTSLSGASAAG